MELGWTIVYVKNVEAAVRFYRNAFGLELRFLVDTKDYAEMETGATALAFASNRFAAMHMPAPIRESDPDEPAPGFTVSFRSNDVAADYERAIGAGATALSPPAVQPWGQTTACVRDPDGVMIEIASPLVFGA